MPKFNMFDINNGRVVAYNSEVPELLRFRAELVETGFYKRSDFAIHPVELGNVMFVPSTSVPAEVGLALPLK